MKILLAGAFGNLGIEILKVLCEGGHEVIAADLKEKENNGLEGKYTFRAIDATKKETMKGICDGAEVVITTMGLTTSSTKFTAYDIDYQGNLNLLEEAKAAGVGKFNYISVIACKEPGAEKVPMLHAKAMFEDELVKSGLEYVIYRPTGYFYDIAKVFKPYIDKGEMQLRGTHDGHKRDLRGRRQGDLHLRGDGQALLPRGRKARHHQGQPDLDVLYFGKHLPKIKKAGKHDIILFSKWTLSHDLVGKDVTGDHSFKEYINEYFGRK